MAKDDSTTQTAPAPATPAAATPPAAPAWVPKRGDFVNYTETLTSGPNKGTARNHFLLVTEVGTTTGPKRDEKGAVITKQADVKFGDGTRSVTQAVMETVPVFGGVILSALEQFPHPKRGILLEALSPLEG